MRIGTSTCLRNRVFIGSNPMRGTLLLFKDIVFTFKYGHYSKRHRRSRMRTIKHIVLHCTAGPQNQKTSDIQDYWKKSLGWKSPGYHHIINADGSVDDLLPISSPSNGVAGYNANSIHISYKGGANGVDNRTPEQIQAQIELVKKYKGMFPGAEVKGHRDFPGVTKLCPSFDVKHWLKCVGLN